MMFYRENTLVRKSNGTSRILHYLIKCDSRYRVRYIRPRRYMRIGVGFEE